MPATDEPDDTRLAGRMPRRQVDAAVAAAASRWRGQPTAEADVADADPAGEPGTSDTSGDDAIDDHELEAVTRLMGFLRGDED